MARPQGLRDHGVALAEQEEQGQEAEAEQHRPMHQPRPESTGEVTVRGGVEPFSAHGRDRHGRDGPPTTRSRRPTVGQVGDEIGHRDAVALGLAGIGQQVVRLAGGSTASSAIGSSRTNATRAVNTAGHSRLWRPGGKRRRARAKSGHRAMASTSAQTAPAGSRTGCRARAPEAGRPAGRGTGLGHGRGRVRACRWRGDRWTASPHLSGFAAPGAAGATYGVAAAIQGPGAASFMTSD